MWGRATAHQVVGNDLTSFVSRRSWIQVRDAHFRKHLQHGGQVVVYRLRDLDGNIRPLLSRTMDGTDQRYMMLKAKGNWVWRHLASGEVSVRRACCE
jgi:hypothetical protein